MFEKKNINIFITVLMTYHKEVRLGQVYYFVLHYSNFAELINYVCKINRSTVTDYKYFTVLK